MGDFSGRINMFFYRALPQITWFLVVASIFIYSVERTFLKRGRAKPYAVAQVASGDGVAHAAPIVDAGVVRAREASKRIDEAQADIERAKQQIRTWEREIEPLRESAEGARITEKEELAGKISYVFNEDRPTLAAVEEIGRSLEGHRAEAAKLAAGAGHGRVDRDTLNEIEAAQEAAASAADKWTNAVERAKAIVRESTRVVGDSLQSTIEQFRDQQVLADFEADREALRQRKEAQRLRREDERIEEERLAAEKTKLVAEALSVEVQAVLAPFIEKSTLQIRVSGVGTVGRYRVAHPQGKSYSSLVNSGALVDSVEGRKMLARIGRDRKLSTNPWPFGSQPNNWTDANEGVINQAQDYLRRLGPIMVSERILAP